MRAVAVALVLLLAAGSATADEKPAVEKPAPVADVADAVQAAHGRGATEELAAHALQREPDPWLVAAELCHRKQFDAAAALATATKSPWLAGLKAYVASRREKPVDDVGRAAYVKIEALGASPDPAAWADVFLAADVPLDTVFRIYAALPEAVHLRRPRSSPSSPPASRPPRASSCGCRSRLR